MVTGGWNDEEMQLYVPLSLVLGDMTASALEHLYYSMNLRQRKFLADLM